MSASRLFRRRGDFDGLISGHRVTLLHDGEECFSAMLSAIEGAKTEILLEMYWFGSDGTGRRFADALGARAEAGVVVRVLYDAVGSWTTSEVVFESMRQAGCGVEQYNPIAPWRQRFNVGVVNRRDHRKLLVVDGSIGFTGGVNLADAWAPQDEGGGGWRDDMIRVEGPAVSEMRAIFLGAWERVHGPDPELVGRLPPTAPAAGAATPVRVLATRARGERLAIRRAYLGRIATAETSISITNSYFVPDGAVRRALAEAVTRGVRVRVLLPGESDVPAVQYAARRLYEWHLARGIRLYEWQGPMLHAKSAVIDEDWCTVGTYNFDYRSYRYNLEVAAVVEDRRLGAAMERRFEQDLEQSVPIRRRHWRFRPLSERFFEYFFYLFRKLL